MTTAPVGPAGPAAILAAIDAAALRALALIDAGQITPASATAPSAPPPPSLGQPSSVVGAAAQAAATEQTGLAPLFADLSAALQMPGLPPDVAAAAARVQSLVTPTNPPPTGASLKAAASQSGLLLEATIAATGAPPPDDMKAALLTLRQALASAAEAAPAAAEAEASVAIPNAAAQPLAADAPTAKVTVASAHAEPPPAPPYRDAALRAQPPAAARMPSDAPPATVVRTLLQDVNGALARQVLYQLASLPGAAGPTAPAQPDPAQPHWMFELPFATAQGATPTPFEISRDSGRAAAGGDDAEPTWRARFSLDLGAAGPVHARVALVGGRVRVGLWAEQPTTAEALDAERGALAADLAGLRFDAAVTVLAGQPASPAADPGRFVDRAL
jgi:hypothetical protein